MTPPLDALFAEVRESCSARTWSRGVELARGGAVRQASARAERLELRVRAPGREVALSVTLAPDDGEWSCDCGEARAACEHVAAAVIAARQARRTGEALPGASPVRARLRHVLVRDGARIAVERLIEEAGATRPVTGSLAGAAGLEPTDAERRLDRILAARRVRSLDAGDVETLLPLLAELDQLSFEGRPIAASAEPVLPRALVEERGRDHVLVLSAPDVEAVVAPGLVLVPGAERACLRPLGAVDPRGARLETLPSERRFGPEQLGELAGQILPALEARIEVEVRSRRLERAGAVRVAPAALLEVTQRGGALSILPVLVYGELGRVEGDRLVHLGGALPRRDARGEERVRDALRDELGLVVGKRSDFSGADAVAMAARLRAWTGRIDGDAHVRCYPAEPLAPRVTLEGDRLEVRFETPAGEADPLEVLRLFELGEGAAPLVGGGWAPLPTAWLAEHAARVGELVAARGAGGKLARALAPAVAELCEALALPAPVEIERLMALLRDDGALPAASLDAELAGTLRDYQRRGVDWLCFLRDAGLGAVLADDMGLGKTVQALACFAGRTLVVCPTSVVHNWRLELARFRPALGVAVYHGPDRALEPRADVTLTSYAILRLDAERLAAERWHTVVLDEAHLVKNPDSQTARAAFRLEATFRVALTGTPVENRLEDLWSLLHFANAGLLGDRAAFRARYEEPIARGDGRAAARLARKIRPVVLRRTKAQVLAELPPRIEQILWCELGAEERALYQAVLAAARRDVVALLDAGGSALAALEALLRLRQACCHPSLVPGQRSATSAKLDRLTAALEEAHAEGHRALVFSQWTSLLDLVEPALAAAGVGHCRLDGATRDRAGLVAAFQDASGPPVMLCSLKAGGLGLNLTAADHVFILDPWWNPAAEDQAADRAHRIGQERAVHVCRLVARDTVEERVLDLQIRKRALAAVALDHADAAAGLTREDLLALLA